ncbi:MAG: hypothetical protein ACFFCS_17545 [Candidatus Hodarchaeota archaeon]
MSWKNLMKKMVLCLNERQEWFNVQNMILKGRLTTINQLKYNN